MGEPPFLYVLSNKRDGGAVSQGSELSLELNSTRYDLSGLSYLLWHNPGKCNKMCGALNTRKMVKYTGILLHSANIVVKCQLLVRSQ